MDFASGSSGFVVNPAGSKRVWLNLPARTLGGAPYWPAELDFEVGHLTIPPAITTPTTWLRPAQARGNLVRRQGVEV